MKYIAFAARTLLLPCGVAIGVAITNNDYELALGLLGPAVLMIILLGATPRETQGE